MTGQQPAAGHEAQDCAIAVPAAATPVGVVRGITGRPMCVLELHIAR